MKTEFNIRKRKRELIAENITSAPLAKRGAGFVRFSVLLILSLRLALLIYDCIYLGIIGAENSVLVQLLIIPLIIILYMLYDGNKAMSYILMISAAGRLLYHFTAMLPSLPTDGVTIYTIIYQLVFEIQFAFAIFMAANSKCDIYFTAMQKINLKLRSEMLGK